ncbi:MAG TPA: hypothetical protein VKS78_12555 [Roseiarcus sp.]|nr:hypothetical protein [Roseiarcus sp.]
MGVQGLARTLGSVLAFTLSSVAIAQDAPKRLAASDLSVETHEWDGKSIQTTVQCVYLGANDYKCAVVPITGNGLVRMDFSSVDPPEMKKVIEENCDTVEKMTTKACRFQVEFIYELNDRQKNADGSTTMRIGAKDDAGAFSPTK